MRTPLTEPPAEHVDELASIIASGRAVLDKYRAGEGE